MTLTMRDRMKRETNLALTRAAQDLVNERGLAAVTVEDIVNSAGVSVRTFFNYFACKEAAVVGIPAEVTDELVRQLRDRPPDEAPVDALRAVVLAQLDEPTIQSRWQIRTELVRREPVLLPFHLAALAQLESALVHPIAERMGVDPNTDPEPTLLAASLVGSLRAAAGWWERSDRRTPLSEVLDAAFLRS